jgi:cytochrome c oxidase cbb3-type subunit II
MRMNLGLIVFGGLLIFASVLFIAVILPWTTISEKPSDIFRPRSVLESRGRELYVRNGCTFCHTQFVRDMDWDLGSERIALSGDYVQDQPHLVGTERTGPDLSQEGGEHPDDWHLAHFTNPRLVRPESIMPAWAFLGRENIRALIAYKQSLGFRLADFRVQRQKTWKAEAVRAFEAGPDENIDWLHRMVPAPWRKLPNPYATTAAGLARGHKIYQGFCIGCHGPIGDGMGPAEPYLYPPPLNFTLLRQRGISGGILYHQIMNGITGTAMPYFKRELESAKIWEVGNYVAVYFIGASDARQPPRGIEASYEPPENEPLNKALKEEKEQ